jgi:DNA-nicking Smr family endonuclease
MASAHDLADLGTLLKQERKAARKERRSAERSALMSEQSAAEKSLPNVPVERFADFFRPWREFTPPTADDLAAFRAAVPAVAPGRGAPRADAGHVRPAPHARHREADELAALVASQLAMNPSPMSWDIGADIEDEQSYLRGGVSPDLLRKLRRGEWTINAEIDLHHHNQDEAHKALMEFMRMARLAGWRCVRIIHGKGLSSHQKLPVLRNKVRRWLQHKDEVLAYCEPRPNGGGSGAVLVLLRGSK